MKSHDCRFEVLEAEWPRPIELSLATDCPILTSLFFWEPYEIETHLIGADQVRYPLGNTFMVLPEHDFTGRGSGGRMRSVRCMFSNRLYEEVLERYGAKPSLEQVTRLLDIRNDTVRLLMRRLMNEALSPGFASDYLLDSVAATLMVECCRHMMDEPEREDEATPMLQPRHIRMVHDYLERCADGAPSLAEIARQCGCSTPHLSRMFKKTTGRTLGQYVTDWRLAKARGLLETTDLPLKQIAHRVGFANAANFSNAFAKRMGVSPGKFRRGETTSAEAVPEAPVSPEAFREIKFEGRWH